MSSKEVNCFGYKFNALIPIQSLNRGSGITNTVSGLTMNDSKVVDGGLKFEFEESLDCLNDLCDVAALEPKGLSSYLIPAVLGSCVKEHTSKSSKNSCHQKCGMDSCIVEGDQLMDGVEQQMMPSVCPSHNASGFMPQPRVTNDLVDLFTTNLFVIRSSPRVLPLALSHQLPAHNFSRISILDLDCDYSGPSVLPDLRHSIITTSLNSAPTGDLLLMDSEDDAMDSTSGGGPNPYLPCFIESPPSHNLALSGTLTAGTPPHLRDGSGYPPIQKKWSVCLSWWRQEFQLPRGVKRSEKKRVLLSRALPFPLESHRVLRLGAAPGPSE
ncbi:hypothetical protein L873DRAFT_329840 [Choiromyces venosus 120613-1]|uniref:Uncharacterized protein n=1 Tax=Choiromyces venosus 120613-1 TaxID=1336337 RepID=A0A3N4K3G5_9PEZI|nr:hypothetical protein L873DRAFT_329840 [Choiromyces venosus 120613-1]